MAPLTEEEKKSMISTLTAFILLLGVLFFAKYTSKNELVDLEGGGGGGGVTVNFGDSDVGSGSDFTSQVLNVQEQKAVRQPAAAAQEDEIVSSDLDDAPAVVNTKPVVKKEPKKEDVKPKPEPVKTPKPSKSTDDALANMINGNSKGGDGDDGVAGNKGKSNGSISSGSYNGDGGSGGGTGGGNGSGNGTGTGPGSGSGSGGGSGSGNGTGVGNYKLAGRKVVTKPAPKYTCNEEGIVVVAISVDQSGKVISAAAGARGTTNPARCLADQAEAAARNTKFDSNPSAAEKQSGTIVYNFKLTD